MKARSQSTLVLNNTVFEIFAIITRALDSINARRLRRLIRGFYHLRGSGRKPYNPLSILKAQLLKHLLRIPSDRRLAFRLKHDRKAARAC